MTFITCKGKVRGLLNEELKTPRVDRQALTVGDRSQRRAARNLLYESQFPKNGARLGAFHDDVADGNNRAACHQDVHDIARFAGAKDGLPRWYGQQTGLETEQFS
jgi:hypothetical protein